VRAGDLAHPTAQSHPDKFEANTAWIAFPVPLKTLYRPTKTMRGDMYVYLRRPKAAIVALNWARKGFATRFPAVSDCKTGIFQTKTNMVRTGHVVLMREELFYGLERYGIVIKVSSDMITVQHYVLPDTLWRLPRKVYAGKLSKCSACRKEDNPLCSACTVVPFPIIHACRDIAAGDELLCLYGSPIATRGVACMLRDDEFKPKWDAY
jgi:hypothetical protein